MLNLNSPLVQQMLSNTPNGSIGNIPGCYGPSPTIENYIIPREMNVSCPSPMEMASVPYEDPLQNQSYLYDSIEQQSGPDYGDRLVMMSNGYQYHQPVREEPPSMDKLRFCGYSEPNIYSQSYGGYQQQYYQSYPAQQSPIFGYNHPVFQGYSNPYMGGNSMYDRGNGYYNPMFPQQQIPIDEHSRNIYEQARYNHISYEEQIEMERELYKDLSRACSAGLGRSEEETNERLKLYDPKPIENNVSQESTMWYNENRVVPPSIRVRVLKGDEVVLDTKDRRPRCNNYANFSYRMHTYNVIERQNQIMFDRRTAKNNWMHDHCPEREMDDCSLIEFFNEHAWKLTAAMNKREMEKQKYLSRDLFDRNLFNQRLERDRARFNATKSMDFVERRINRIAESVEASPVTSQNGQLVRGKNGILPDGSQISPNVDPSIAESFTLDRSTGKLHIDMPIYMKERLGIPLSEQDMKFKIAEDEFVKMAMGPTQ